MVELPTELWLRIAHFIPDEDLFRLASVNHLFLDQAGDRRYRELVLDDDRPEVLTNKLKKMQQDPITAGRVRSLEIHPKAIRSAWLKSQSTKRSKSLFSLYLHSSLKPRATLQKDPSSSSLFASLLSAFSKTTIDSYTISWAHSLSDELPFCFPLLTSLWRAIDAPRNLRILDIDMPLGHLGSLIQQIPEGLKFERLQELVFRFTHTIDDNGARTDFGIGPGVPIPALGFASPVSISSEDVGPRRRSPTLISTPTPALTPHAQAFLHLSKFILSLSSTLTSLTLSLSNTTSDRSYTPPSLPTHSQRCQVDFSSLFEYLLGWDDDRDSEDDDNYHTSSEIEKDFLSDTVSIPLPNLTHLTLRIPIDPTHLRDTEGFNAFLKAQSGVLESLRFEPVFCCSPAGLGVGLGGGSAHPRYDVREARWLDDVFDDELSFPSLRELQVGLSSEQAQANPCGTLGSRRVIPAVQRLCQAVAFSNDNKGLLALSLSITGTIISLDDMRALLLPFASSPSPSSQHQHSEDPIAHANPQREAPAPTKNAPRTLILQVHILDIHLLDLLAELLPGLETLNLTYKWVEKAGGTDAPEFTAHLRGKRYHAWKLSSLVLTSSRGDDEARWDCQKAIMRCVPGMSR